MNLFNELLMDLRATNNTIVGENPSPSRICVITLKDPSLIASIAKTYGYSSKVVLTRKSDDGLEHCIDCRVDSAITPDWEKIKKDREDEIEFLKAVGLMEII